LKTSFSANLICKKFEAGKLKFFPKLRLFMLQFTDKRSPIAHNVPAAWRSGG
jgi:hypothetical protein